MTPNQFVLEQWKVYEAYIQSKERLIEVTTTLYLGLAGGLLLRDAAFWTTNIPHVLLLLAVTAALAWVFVLWQMSLRRKATSISEACQSLMAEWLPHPPNLLHSGLEPEVRKGKLEGVKFPKAVWEEISTREKRQRGCWDRLKSYVFGIVVCGLMAAWTLAVTYRVYLAHTQGHYYGG